MIHRLRCWLPVMMVEIAVLTSIVLGLFLHQVCWVQALYIQVFTPSCSILRTFTSTAIRIEVWIIWSSTIITRIVPRKCQGMSSIHFHATPSLKLVIPFVNYLWLSPNLLFVHYLHIIAYWHNPTQGIFLGNCRKFFVNIILHLIL